MLHKMPIIMSLTIVLVALLSNVMPYDLQSFLFSISMSIREVMMACLPIVVFTLLLKSSLELAGGATKTMLLIVALVCCSSFTATFLSHYVGAAVYHMNWSIPVVAGTAKLVPMWTFHLPKLVSNDKAMIAGFVCGLLLYKFRPNVLPKLAPKLDSVVTSVFNVVVFCMPLFITGFIVKLNFEGTMSLMLHNYSLIFVMIAVTQLLYIFAMYFVFSGCNLSLFLSSVRNMLPAGISGFATMSSAACMPLSIIGVERNTSKEFARCIVPATTNIHMLGDCFAIPILSYAIMKGFGFSEPTVLEHLVFTSYFVLTKFSGAAVPAGSIIIMIPILEEYFGFNADMVSLITALYVLFDPVFTCANVMGNGAFARMAYTFLHRKRVAN